MAAGMAGMAGMGGMPGMMPGMGASQPSPVAMPGMPSPLIAQGGVSQPGGWVQNVPTPEQDLVPLDPELADSTPGADSDRDAEGLEERPFLEEPWFAKLPPELRRAIRNNSQRRPPRGYEQRLKRYFQSVD